MLIITGLGLAGICSLLFFSGVYFQHRLDILARENRRLVVDAESSAGELQALSQTLIRVAAAARSLDRMNFDSGRVLSLNASVSLNEPEASAPDLEAEMEFVSEVDASRSPSLRGRAEELADKARMLLNFIENIENAVRKRSSLLRAIPSIMPVEGYISSPFGIRRHPLKPSVRKFHRGIDIPARPGTPVVATADGVVRFAGWNRGYGRIVVLNHGMGLVTRYAHNSRILVRRGDVVCRGTRIAEVGSSGLSSGPHIHYEVLLNKSHVDPELFIDISPPRSPLSIAGALARKKRQPMGYEELFQIPDLVAM